uniref:Hypothetical secreted peptide n=1 Tax=Glossina morsitans morsitans TaxID=37546 RepID=D3TSL9_GLOMM
MTGKLKRLRDILVCFGLVWFGLSHSPCPLSRLDRDILTVFVIHDFLRALLVEFSVISELCSSSSKCSL